MRRDAPTVRLAAPRFERTDRFHANESCSRDGYIVLRRRGGGSRSVRQGFAPAGQCPFLLACVRGRARAIRGCGAPTPCVSSVVRSHALLVEEKVEADLHVYEGMWHAFFIYPELPESAAAYSVIARFFDKHLGS